MADPELEEIEQSVRETEDELLKGAFEPAEKPAEEPKAEPKAEPKVERARDPETGRFARAEPEPPQAAQPQPEQPAPPAPEAEGKPEEQVPSWRLREINEERRQAVAELERMRVEHARMQAYMAQIQRAQAPAQAPQAPDPVLDPAGYTKHVQETLRQEFQAQQAFDRLNYDLRFTHNTYGQRFEKAYEALVIEGQRGNAALVRHLTSQASPGEAIMRWYTQNEVLREVGPDPAAYKQKTREELLKDPEFLAQAVEAHRRFATGGNGQPPNTVVKLPPSLSKATGTTEVPTTHTDGSEAALFNYAMNSKRR
jgi:hypothetical protein